LLRAPTLIATCRATDQKEPGLGKDFDPTIAGCGQQGTASSPSSTVKFDIIHGLFQIFEGFYKHFQICDFKEALESPLRPP